MRLALAAQYLGVHPNTVRNWAESGKLPCARIGTRGDRRFTRADLDQLLGGDPIVERREAHYVRGSGRGDHHPSLRAQEAALAAAAAGPVARVYRDVGSGLSERRRGLTRLLDAASRHEFELVRVTHADRLSRFGVSYLERLLAAYGVELVIEDAPAAAETPPETHPESPAGTSV